MTHYRSANHTAIKMLLIGDSGVGKTSLLLRFTENAFSQSFLTTIGIDFKVKTVEVDGERYKLQIWDTAGQERFRTITTAYYRGAHGIMLVYDCTDEQSFWNVRNWIKAIESYANSNVSIVLIANKCDMPDREVTTEQGQDLADEYQVPYFETSAKSGDNVAESYMKLTRLICDKGVIEKKPSAIRPEDMKNKTDNQKCAC